MGGVLSNPVDEDAQRRISEITDGFVGEFTSQFALEYNIALIDEIKKEKDTENKMQDGDDGSFLTEAKLASWIIKTGMLTKDGDENALVSSKHARWFVAKNALDNYDIEYYASETAKKPIGTIQCCGYRCDVFDEDDKAKGNEWGVVLTPYDSERRKWILHAETEEDQNAWASVFDTACSKAGPPLHKNPVIATAFMNAFRTACWRNGLYTAGCHCSEVENITTAIYDLIYEAVLRDDVFPKIPEGAFHDRVESTVKTTIKATISGGARGAWATAAAAAEASTEAVKSLIAGAMEPIFDAEKKLITKASKVVAATISRPVKKIIDSATPALVKSVSQALVESMPEAVKGFKSEADRVITDMKAKMPTTVEELLEFQQDLERNVYHSWSGPLSKVRDFAYPVVKHLNDDNIFKFSNMRSYDMYTAIQESCQRLFMDTSFTFFEKLYTIIKAGDTITEDDIDRALKKTLGMSAHDTETYGVKCLVDVLKDLIRSQDVWKSTVDEPLASALEPLEEIVAAFPDPVPQFVALAPAINKVVDNSLRAAIESTVSSKVKQINVSKLVKDVGGSTQTSKGKGKE